MIIRVDERAIPNLGMLAIAIAEVQGRPAVLAIGFPEHGDAPNVDHWLATGTPLVSQRDPFHDHVFQALRLYADGRRLPAIPVSTRHLSPFTQHVLGATAAIPFGNTCTYRDIAQSIGKPGAARAIGQALGRNPVPILIPCHRVTGTGHLGGFTPGLTIKRRLLAIEGVTFPR